MYNRTGTPKFYIDAVLLARQLGFIETENSDGLFYLNPTKTKNFVFSAESNIKYIYIDFKNRYFLNSLTHCFILGHQFHDDDIGVTAKSETKKIDGNWFTHSHTGLIDLSNNGWNKLDSFTQGTSLDLQRFVLSFTGETSQTFNIGDISAGWSFEMQHSSDLELTQTFGNESLKTQTTKSGVTLSNVGWNQPPKWGNYPQWKKSPNDIVYPARRSWNLKFSYLSDDHSSSPLMPQYYNEWDVDNDNRGIFERTSTDSFSIKDDFLSKVMPSINLGLPFIFQPNKDVEEYAICRVNANSVTMNQVANNVYDISLSIVETW
jgi:hypothetical protein